MVIKLNNVIKKLFDKMQIKILAHQLSSKTMHIIPSETMEYNKSSIYPPSNKQNPHLLSSIHNHEEDRIEERLNPKHQYKLRADIGEHSESRLADKTDDDKQSEQ